MKGYAAVSVSHRRGSWIKRKEWTQYVRILGNRMVAEDTSTTLAVPLADLIANDWEVKSRQVNNIDAQIARLQQRRDALTKGAN